MQTLNATRSILDWYLDESCVRGDDGALSWNFRNVDHISWWLHSKDDYWGRSWVLPGWLGRLAGWLLGWLGGWLGGFLASWLTSGAGISDAGA
jgi:hypothetical protein